MIVVEVKELEDWWTYCKDNPNAKQCANKTVEHWDDIYVLVGPDRATGDGAEQIEDSATAMNTEGPNMRKVVARRLLRIQTRDLRKIIWWMLCRISRVHSSYM